MICTTYVEYVRRRMRKSILGSQWKKMLELGGNFPGSFLFLCLEIANPFEVFALEIWGPWVLRPNTFAVDLSPPYSSGSYSLGESISKLIISNKLCSRDYITCRANLAKTNLAGINTYVLHSKAENTFFHVSVFLSFNFSPVFCSKKYIIAFLHLHPSLFLNIHKNAHFENLLRRNELRLGET